MTQREIDGVDAVFSLVLAFPLVVWEGFVVRHLWTWFAVPMGAPAMTLESAAGLALLAGLVTMKVPREEPDKARETPQSARVIVAGFTALVALGTGWLIRAVL